MHVPGGQGTMTESSMPRASAAILIGAAMLAPSVQPVIAMPVLPAACMNVAASDLHPAANKLSASGALA